jgi:hypothetical protein
VKGFQSVFADVFAHLSVGFVPQLKRLTILPSTILIAAVTPLPPSIQEANRRSRTRLEKVA